MPISTFPLYYNNYIKCTRNHLPIQQEETIKAVWTLRSTRPLPFAHTRSWLVIAPASPFPKAQGRFSGCSRFQFDSLQWLFQEAICFRMLPLESWGHTWECFMNNLHFATMIIFEGNFSKMSPKVDQQLHMFFQILGHSKMEEIPITTNTCHLYNKYCRITKHLATEITHLLTKYTPYLSLWEWFKLFFESVDKEVSVTIVSKHVLQQLDSDFVRILSLLRQESN